MDRSQPGTNDTVSVQTELEMDEYWRVRDLAREQGLTVEDAVYQALVEWIERKQQLDPSDPAFTVHHGFKDDLPPRSTTTDARYISDTVDEWHGSDESLKLADDPSPNS